MKITAGRTKEKRAHDAAFAELRALDPLCSATVPYAQKDVYAAKELEARLFKAGLMTEQEAELLQAEAAVRGISVQALAAQVIAAANQMHRGMAAIEARRVGAILGHGSANSIPGGAPHLGTDPKPPRPRRKP